MKDWKNREQRVSWMFGGNGRVPLSGSNSRGTSADALHPRLYIEHKHRAKVALISLWDKTKKLAKREHKRPVVTVSVRGRPGIWIFCHSDDLIPIAEEKKTMDEIAKSLAAMSAESDGNDKMTYSVIMGGFGRIARESNLTLKKVADIVKDTAIKNPHLPLVKIFDQLKRFYCPSYSGSDEWPG